MLKRTAWGVADQALSSLTNFVLVIVVARTLSRAAFGGFGIALAIYALALGISRAICSEPFAVCCSTESADQTRGEARGALGAACSLSLVAATLVGMLAVVVGGDIGQAALPLALVMPALLVQDSYRYVFISGKRPRAASANDAVWAVVQFGLLGALATGSLGVEEIVLVWGAGATLGAIVAVFQSRLLPAPALAVTWLRRYRHLWPRFATEFVAASCGWQFTLFALGAIGGLDAVGALRGGQALVGPLNVFFLAVPLVAIAEGARLWKTGRVEPVRFSRWLAGALVTLALAWGGVLALLPDNVGHALLGSTWASARTLLLPLVLVMAAVGAGLGALAGLRVLGASRNSMRARLLVVPLVVVGSVTGAVMGDASGAAWGWAVATALAVVVWWRQLLLAQREAGAEQIGATEILAVLP